MNELIKLLEKTGLNINQILYLWSIRVPNNLTGKHITLSIQEADILYELGYFSTQTGAITDLGHTVIDEVESLFKKSKTKSIPASVKDYPERINEYRELWPKMILPSGKASRVSEKVIRDCFIWFFTNYTYNWIIVLKATELYLEQQQSVNYKMCRTSQYFIVKMTGGIKESLLADYCELIDKGIDDNKNYFPIKVV